MSLKIGDRVIYRVLSLYANDGSLIIGKAIILKESKVLTNRFLIEIDDNFKNEKVKTWVDMSEIFLDIEFYINQRDEKINFLLKDNNI